MSFYVVESTNYQYMDDTFRVTERTSDIDLGTQQLVRKDFLRGLDISLPESPEARTPNKPYINIGI